MSQESPICNHLDHFLQAREPPKTFCPSEVARALSSSELQVEGASQWRDLMPRIRELAWARRDAGSLEVVQKGNVLGSEVTLAEVTGPIRLRRT